MPYSDFPACWGIVLKWNFYFEGIEMKIFKKVDASYRQKWKYITSEFWRHVTYFLSYYVYELKAVCGFSSQNIWLRTLWFSQLLLIKALISFFICWNCLYTTFHSKWKKYVAIVVDFNVSGITKLQMLLRYSKMHSRAPFNVSLWSKRIIAYVAAQISLSHYLHEIFGIILSIYMEMVYSQ